MAAPKKSQSELDRLRKLEMKASQLTLRPSSEDKDPEESYVMTPSLGTRASARGMKLAPMKIRLLIEATIDGTAATAMTDTINVRPGGTGEFSSCAALYDEVKVLSGEMTYLFRIKTASASAVTAAMGVMAYDPVNSATLSSVVNGMQHSQHQMVSLPNNDAIPGYCSVPAKSRDGYQHFRFRCPSGVQRVPGTAGVSTGTWTDTVTTTADYGYIKLYINAANGQTFSVRYVLSMLCEFRSRS
jgi:hypothetical protein